MKSEQLELPIIEEFLLSEALLTPQRSLQNNVELLEIIAFYLAYDTENLNLLEARRIAWQEFIVKTQSLD